MPAAEMVARIERCKGCYFCFAERCKHVLARVSRPGPLGSTQCVEPWCWDVTDCPLAAGAANERGDE